MEKISTDALVQLWKAAVAELENRGYFEQKKTDFDLYRANKKKEVTEALLKYGPLTEEERGISSGPQRCIAYKNRTGCSVRESFVVSTDY